MNKRTKNKIKKVFDLLTEQIADIFPYFFGFYIIALLMSLFFERWKQFFNWPAFHISVIILGGLSFYAKKDKLKIKQKLFSSKKAIVPKAIFILKLAKPLIKYIFQRIKYKIKGVRKITIIKICLIIIVLILSLYKNIEPIDLLILGYGLISFLFILESRISVGFALIFLVSCPILLILKKQGIAEQMAVYAYYFLVIGVLTQIREFLKEQKL